MIEMLKLVLGIALALVAVQANEEANLLAAIVDGYPPLGKYVRPVAKTLDAVTVDFGVSPIRIVDFKAKGGHSGYGSLTIAGWLTMSWTDVNIGWTPEEYGGISKLRLPIEIVREKIWLPDMVPYDGAPWTERTQEVDLVVMSSGMMIYIPPAILDYECSPADAANATTVCEAKYGSWTQDGYLVDIGMEPTVDASNMVKDPEWTVLDAKAERIVKTYDCCPEPYPSVKVTMTLQSNEGPFVQKK